MSGYSGGYLDLDDDCMYFVAPVANAGSQNMNVNGSVTPVNFDYQAAADFYLVAVNFMLYDSGSTLPTSFGAIAGGLTNGLALKVQSKGVEYSVATLKTNIDVVTTFRSAPLITPTSGFMETADIYIATLMFPVPIRITLAASDYVRFRVQDNLTGLDQCQATVLGRLTI